MLPVTGFLSVGSPGSFLSSVGVLLPSVSDPFPCPSCLCLPLCISFSCCPSSARRERAAASSVLALGTCLVLEANALAQLRGSSVRATIPRAIGLDHSTHAAKPSGLSRHCRSNAVNERPFNAGSICLVR